MHLLSTQPGGFVEADSGVVRIAQDPADLVILSAADTTLALLASVAAQLPPDFPTIRLSNLLYLKQPASIDWYLDDVLQHAKVIVMDHLGGQSYWPYGTEQVVALARQQGIALAMFSGDLTEDVHLLQQSSVAPDRCHRLWRYLREGGTANALQFYYQIGAWFFNRHEPVLPPQPLPAVVIYKPTQGAVDISAWQADWQPEAPVVAIVFYRAHVQAANTGVFDALIAALQAHGMNPLPVALASLKQTVDFETVQRLGRVHRVALVLNTTAFCAAALDTTDATTPLAGTAPVLQVILSGNNRADWQRHPQGLNTQDMAMHIALPEVDGRVITRAISFKGLDHHCDRTQTDVVCYQPDAERIQFVAELSRRWCRLQTIPNAQKRVALIVANYPTREGRIGNGVGLDTPQSVVNILHLLKQHGYTLGTAALPTDGTALMEILLQGVTNEADRRALRPAHQSLAMDDYYRYFNALPESNRHAITQQWGLPEQDPMVRPLSPRSAGASEGAQKRFMIAGLRFGNVFIGIQPARGYQLDTYACYHDPDLVPPHHYLAFYWWVRHVFQTDVIVHVGKHGNLEWLPGKSVALSDGCWPDAILGPLPHLYPFIVNDPGEGAQAKRRTHAVILDHLMPPLTRAETYGPLSALERQLDEYYDALSIDPRRAALLQRTLLEAMVAHQLHQEVGMAEPPRDTATEAQLLKKVDAYLCELKESQIRDGLHIFGQSPQGRQQRDTLLALARLPVGDGRGGQAGLLTALSRDLALGDEFDPLDVDGAALWTGPRPAVLCAMSEALWRTQGDTRERLERLAQRLIERSCQDASGPALEPEESPLPFFFEEESLSFEKGETWRDTGASGDSATAPETPNTPSAETIPPFEKENPLYPPFEKGGAGGDLSFEKGGIGRDWPFETEEADGDWAILAALPQTQQVLRRIIQQIRPALLACGPHEHRHLLDGLNGHFVPPGPSGAPSRGRLDVLPTGRNFYSVDLRRIPTPTAWQLGFKSAHQVIERYLQEQGDYPRTLGLSVWGTATMRTGGDDIAQALAFLGVRPVWDSGSYRVCDFEILPLSVLDRPRIDVTLRVSGLFRDAFATLMRLFDAAVQAVAAQDEPDDLNFVRARITHETHLLMQQGINPHQARRQAGWRVFSTKPGAYGTGLQGVIDQGCWHTEADLAQVYQTWSGYAYGQEDYGEAAADALRARLSSLDVVLQNQDNREHDLLDSDDYYQFQGGMTAAVRHLSGRQPVVYHGDHSQPHAPRIRSLKEEISRVIRARVVNPKWLDGIKRHGYKGAFEIAATVDYLFAYDATTQVIEDYQYALVTDAYVLDAATRDFMQQHNPNAFKELCERLLEAIQRGLWQSPGDYRTHLEHWVLATEDRLETRG